MAEPRRRPEDWLAQRGLAQALLAPPAVLMGWASRLRAALYDRRLLGAFEAGVPVVSLGNLTAGGTGKTPAAVLVVELLHALGHRPALLSRGYGAREGAPNDEALELARLLPGVDHVQDPDRVAGARRLVDRGATAIVLDDGFQHRRLAREVDLVLIDATRPLGLPAPAAGGEPVEAFLPRGLLREPPTALARAHAILLTRTDQVGAAALEALEVRVAGWAPGVPVLHTRHAPARLLTPEGPRPLEEFAGTEVRLLSGIGNPGAFEATARSLGAHIREHRAHPDHHAFRAEDLPEREGPPILCTLKDASKLEALGLRPWVLEVRLEVVRGASWLEELLGLLAPLPEGVTRPAEPHHG
ncbi:MAG: tetraacyldisaccharide 4'-kinase [Planctomycetes bacterium]|nr:tetraacyldisaccharide 4'-kinase [Planctomycetota bacterium]